MFISPSEIRNAQENYIQQAEDRALYSLIRQFNEQMITMPTNQPEYTVRLFLERNAGFYYTITVRNRFISHCEAAGWHIKSISINECQIIAKVSPRVMH
jgi:hypothetical protein